MQGGAHVAGATDTGRQLTEENTCCRSSRGGKIWSNAKYLTRQSLGNPANERIDVY